MTYKTRFLSSAVVAAMITMAGCPAGDDAGDDGGNGSTTDTPVTGGMDATMTATNGMTSGNMTDTAESSGGPTTMTDPSDSGSTGAPPTDVPNGGACMSDEACESGNCFETPIISLCGECDEDADCAGGGCSIPNPLTMAPSVCNMGELGGGCETTDVCEEGLVCALILSVDAIMLTASTCSECETDADCDAVTPGSLCSPTYNVADISGYKSCVMPGTVANGLGCDFMGSGNDACESGLCTPADAAGFVELGICSDCGTDGMGNEVMCMGQDVCTPAEVSLSEGLLPGTCGPA